MATKDRPYRSAQPTGVLSPGSVLDKVTDAIFRETPLWWWIGFGISFALLIVFIFTVVQIVVLQGVGLWDINMPVVWGIAIVNLVFWIGIGHAGTFISAFLMLMRQHWRSAFSRFAEAMTLFALATAALFPIIHLGRPQYAFWLAPYPNNINLNPQWRSALIWDFFAINTYGLISTIFWFIDLLPDLAAMRDKAKRPVAKIFYGLLSMGWRGDAQHWESLHRVTFLLAALATPLVISVHSIVGLDFAIANVPGWAHSIFPPYFVAGAVFSGFAMVLIVATGLRKGFGLEELITLDHLDKGAKLMLVTSLLVGYGYTVEVFGAWLTGHTAEWLLTINRAIGFYAPAYWAMIFFNVILTQLLWFKSVRRNTTMLVLICLGVLVGMWLERFVIISISLTYSYMPTMWEPFIPTLWDWLTIISPFGLFLTLLFLFIRLLPVLPIFEKQQLAAEEAAA